MWDFDLDLDISAELLEDLEEGKASRLDFIKMDWRGCLKKGNRRESGCNNPVQRTGEGTTLECADLEKLMRGSSGRIRQAAGRVNPELGKEVGLAMKIWELAECKYMPRWWVGRLQEDRIARWEEGQSRLTGDLATADGTKEQPVRGIRCYGAKGA